MPSRRGARLLKRWHYVGVFGPELMACVGDAKVGPVTQRWWAIAFPDGTLRERTTSRRGGVLLERGRAEVEAGDVRISLRLEEGVGVEVASPSGRHYIWTRKQAGVAARGTIRVDGREHRVDAPAIVDESAGYHERRTWWRWSAGVGRAQSGHPVAWNLVTGVHDGDPGENTVWIDGEPRDVGPVEFADDLSGVGGLGFKAWCAREDRTNRLLFRSDYRQPFGTFSGDLPGGVPLAEGYGVMEEHDVRW
jgi:hypothetical protein